MWAKIQPSQLDQKYAKPITGGIWSIDLVVDPDNLKILQKEGLDHLINTKEDGSKIFKFKRNEFQKDQKDRTKRGKTNTPPTVVDANKQPVTEEVGNGSMVQISFTTYTGFKSKKYATLQGVMVEDLVRFDRTKSRDPVDQFEEVEEGDDPPFESSKAATV